MSVVRTVAIMQPTYLPWVGYFDMIDQCDLFVLYDCVQFTKRSWQQRNRIKTATGEVWLTVPVLSQGRRDQEVHEVQIDPDSDFRDKHIRTLRHAYGRAVHGKPFLDAVEGVLGVRHSRLAALNSDLITAMCAALGIRTPIVMSSSLAASGRNVSRLISVCQVVGATRYLSPMGSHGYIDLDNRFAEQSLELVYHAYAHPHYPQLHGAFVSHMSAVDLLMNEGPDSLQILRSGRRAPLSHDETRVRLAASALPTEPTAE